MLPLSEPKTTRLALRPKTNTGKHDTRSPSHKTCQATGGEPKEHGRMRNRLRLLASCRRCPPLVHLLDLTGPLDSKSLGLEAWGSRVLRPIGSFFFLAGASTFGGHSVLVSAFIHARLKDSLWLIFREHRDWWMVMGFSCVLRDVKCKGTKRMFCCSRPGIYLLAFWPVVNLAVFVHRDHLPARSHQHTSIIECNRHKIKREP